MARLHLSLAPYAAAWVSLEGALLYATLLESIGIEPVLVFIPGHAFVAWKPSPADGTREPRFYLETTMTGSAYTFEDAKQVATRTFRKIAAERHFEIGDAGLIDITALRKAATRRSRTDSQPPRADRELEPPPCQRRPISRRACASAPDAR